MFKNLRKWASGLFARKQPEPTEKQREMQRTAEDAMRQRMLRRRRVLEQPELAATEPEVEREPSPATEELPAATAASPLIELDGPKAVNPQIAALDKPEIASTPASLPPLEAPDSDATRNELPDIPGDDERPPVSTGLDASGELPAATLPLLESPAATRPTPEPRAEADATPSRPEPLPADDIDATPAASVELPEVDATTSAAVKVPEADVTPVANIELPEADDATELPDVAMPEADEPSQPELSDEHADRTRRDPGFQGVYTPQLAGPPRAIGFPEQGFVPGTSSPSLPVPDELQRGEDSDRESGERSELLAELREMIEELKEAAAAQKEVSDQIKETISQLKETLDKTGEALGEIYETVVKIENELPTIGALR